MAYVDITVTGEPSVARGIAAEALAAHGFTLGWVDEWHATAERGSSTKAVLLGAFSPHTKVDLQVLAGTQPDQSILRLTRTNSGMLGGAIGAHRTKSGFEKLRDELAAELHRRGVYVAHVVG